MAESLLRTQSMLRVTTIAGVVAVAIACVPPAMKRPAARHHLVSSRRIESPGLAERCREILKMDEGLRFE
jgi:hypothetical protein